jgi:GNAT superfamily N-acetyltransferase
VPSASPSEVADLAGLLLAAASGQPPPADGRVTLVDPPDARSVGVLAFTAHHVISAPVGQDWVHGVLPAGDLSAPLNPPFLTALAAATGRAVNNIDAVFVATGAVGTALGLRPAAADIDHARAAQARAHRTDVRVWTVPGGVLVLGRGVAGRWEISVEVDPGAQGRGLGRALFAAATHLVAPPVWAQVAPGNVASVRAVLGAGYRPIGAEALFIPPAGVR